MWTDEITEPPATSLEAQFEDGTDDEAPLSRHSTLLSLLTSMVSVNAELVWDSLTRLDLKSANFHGTLQPLYAICCNRKLADGERACAAMLLGSMLADRTTLVPSCGMAKYEQFIQGLLTRIQAESDEWTRMHLGQLIGGAAAQRDQWPALARFVRESAASEDPAAQHALLCVCSHAPVRLWDSACVRALIDRALSSSSAGLVRAGLGALTNRLDSADDAWLPRLTPEMFERCEEMVTGVTTMDHDLVVAMNVLTERAGLGGLMGLRCLSLTYAIQLLTVDDHPFAQLVGVRSCIEFGSQHIKELSDEAVKDMVSFWLLGIGRTIEFTWVEKSRHVRKPGFVTKTVDNSKDEHSDSEDNDNSNDGEPELTDFSPETLLGVVLVLLNDEIRAGVAMIEATRPLLEHAHWSMRAAALRGLYIYGDKCSVDMAATLIDCATRGIGDEDARVRYCGSLLLRSIVRRYGDELYHKKFDYENALLALIPRIDTERDPRVARAVLKALAVVMRDTRSAPLAAQYDTLHARLIGVLRCPLVADLRPLALQALDHLYKVEERFAEDFPEILRSYADGNSRHLMSGTADLSECFICAEQPTDVAIRKTCELKACDGCACPEPRLCMACTSRVFLADLARRDSPRCPFCRREFCAEDVHFVSEKATEGR